MSLEAQLAASKNSGSRRRTVNEAGEVPTAALVYRLCEHARTRMRADVLEASNYAAAACDIARMVRDPKAIAEALRIKGHVEYLRGRHKEAARTYQKAVGILEQLGEHVDVGRTLSSALQTLIYLGRYEQALTWAQRAREIFEEEGDWLRLARLDSNVANILHRQEQYGDALRLYESALAKLEELEDDESAAITLRNMAVSYMSIHDFSSALRTNEKALAYYRRKGLTLLEAEVNDNIAYLHSLKGNYTKAIALYQKANLEQRGSSYHVAVSKLDQSDLYLELNLFTEAAQLALDAAGRFRKLGMPHDRAKSLVNLGTAVTRLGEIERGLRLFGQARKLFVQEQNAFSVAVTDLHRGAALLELGELSAARQVVQSAYAVLGASSLAGKAVAAAVLLGRICLAAGDLPGARQAAAEAAGRLQRTETAPLRFRVHALHGAVAEADGDSRAALSALLKAHGVIESLRGHLQHDELKVAFLDDKQHVYEKLVELLLLERGPAEALCYVERAKSWSLADAIAEQPESRTEAHGLRFANGNVIASLREELSWLYRRLDRVDVAPKTGQNTNSTQLPDEIAACERRLVSALTTLRLADPDISLPHHAPDFRPEMLQALLPEETCVLEYFELRGALHLFVISRRNLRHIELGPTEAVRRARRLMSFQMSRGRQFHSSAAADENDWMSATLRHLRALYDILIRPAEPWLTKGHWVIVPHGDLHGLPFHALHDGSCYVIDLHSVSYSPSAAILQLCSSRAPVPHEQALVMGVPDDAAPFLRRECELIADMLPQARLYLGKEATAERLRGESANCRYLHLATHGVFRADNPMFSSLRLGDSRFCVFDFYELRLEAELATLSGCSTGVHEVMGADEIGGLTRALLLAGARAVQVSLWDVNDSSTADYMQSFYASLAAGTGICDAMRKSMLELRQTRRHPYFWAPFAYVGRLPEARIFFPSFSNPLGVNSDARSF